MRYAVWETLAARACQSAAWTAALDMEDGLLTADGEAGCCSADNGQQDGDGWVLKDEAWQSQAGEVACHDWGGWIRWIRYGGYGVYGLYCDD